MTSKNNAIVTEICNSRHITHNQRNFLEIAARINIEEKRPFTCYDFHTLPGTSFRQMIYRLGDIVEIAYKSNPCSYRIKGTPWNKKMPDVTNRPMGDAMISILQSLKEQPPKVHDIKMKAYSDLHSNISHDHMDPHNHSIKLRFQLDQKTHSTVLVYPNMLQIDIACTRKPVVYDIAGIIHLTALLGQLLAFLQYKSNFRASFAPITEWIITHYHFGIDGKEEYNGPLFHMSYGDCMAGLIRFYSKWNGKSLIPRIEQTQTPMRSLGDEISKVIASHNS